MPKAPAKPALPAEPASYEAALEELEQLVARIESGQMPLDQLLAGYQRGAALLAFCRDRLQACSCPSSSTLIWSCTAVSRSR